MGWMLKLFTETPSVEKGEMILTDKPGFGIEFDKNTHSLASLYEAFAPEEAKRLADRLEIHHTPKHGSWLNMAEIELSALGRDLPDRVGDRATLERHVQAWQHRRNAAATKADWQFTTKDARIKLRKLYPTMES